MSTAPLTPEERKEFRDAVRASAANFVAFGGGAITLFVLMPDDWSGFWFLLGVFESVVIVLMSVIALGSLYQLYRLTKNPRRYLEIFNEETEE